MEDHGPERGCLSRSGLDISGASELDGYNSAIPGAAAETAALRRGHVEMRPVPTSRDLSYCTGRIAKAKMGS